MAVENLVYPLLSASSDLAALVGTRIYPTTPTTNTQLPYVVYSVTGADTDVTTTGPIGLTKYGVDLDSYAVNLDTALNVLKAGANALVGGVGGYIQGVFPGDRSTAKEDVGYHATQSFTVWAAESPITITPAATGSVTTGVDSVTLTACSHSLVLDCSGLSLDGQPITSGGGGGGGGSEFVYSQNTPATTWTINHNLDKYPLITVVDSGNSVVIGSIQYPSLNTAVITFTVPFGGFAYLE